MQTEPPAVGGAADPHRRAPRAAGRPHRAGHAPVPQTPVAGPRRGRARARWPPCVATQAGSGGQAAPRHPWGSANRRRRRRWRPRRADAPIASPRGCLRSDPAPAVESVNLHLSQSLLKMLSVNVAHFVGQICTETTENVPARRSHVRRPYVDTARRGRSRWTQRPKRSPRRPLSQRTAATIHAAASSRQPLPPPPLAAASLHLDNPPLARL